MPFFTYQNHSYFYCQAGEARPNRPSVLILHGNTASSASHAHELEFFSTELGYHTLAMDFLGCGRSDRLEPPWPLDWWQQNAAAVVALLAHYGYAQGIPVGCSGGAISALWMAVDYPQRVRAVIADSLCPTYPPGHLTEETENREAQTPDQVAFWSHAHGSDWADVVAADSDYLRSLEIAAPDGLDLFGERLGEIRCPVLFTLSLTDSLLYHPGEQGVQMSKQVPGSWLFAVQGGDHPLMWSCPQAFQAATAAFLHTIEDAHDPA